MDDGSGPATPDVALAPLLSGARRYDFYQLAELLYRRHGDDLESGSEEGEDPARVRFTASSSLGFPGSDVMGLTADEAEGLKMEVRFFGLHGSQSPLPGYYVEHLAHEAAHREGAATAFLDFFHHRLLTLLHRSWRKYRHHVRYQEGGRDGFSAVIYALMGLGDIERRGDVSLPWNRMLAYAGLFAGRCRSAPVVASIVAHCVEHEHVRIEQWVPRRVAVPAVQRSRTGQASMTLGEDMVLGRWVPDIAGKFALCLSGLTLARFREFLPDGGAHEPLLRLMDYVLLDPLAYELRLELLPGAVKPMQLGDVSSTQLGWSTFIDPETSGASTRHQVVIQVNE